MISDTVKNFLLEQLPVTEGADFKLAFDRVIPTANQPEALTKFLRSGLQDPVLEQLRQLASTKESSHSFRWRRTKLTRITDKLLIILDLREDWWFNETQWAPEDPKLSGGACDKKFIEALKYRASALAWAACDKRDLVYFEQQLLHEIANLLHETCLSMLAASRMLDGNDDWVETLQTIASDPTLLELFPPPESSPKPTGTLSDRHDASLPSIYTKLAGHFIDCLKGTASESPAG